MFLSLATLHLFPDYHTTESSFSLSPLVQRLLPVAVVGTSMDVDCHSLLERSRQRAARQREALLAQAREHIRR